MAFESIAAYIDQIEQGFLDKESPAAIAKRLGILEKAKTIQRYKVAVWDLKDLVAESREERAEKHDSKREAAKVEIIKTLDLIEKIKWRANQHLDWNPGDTYKSTNEDGQESNRIASPGQVIHWHSQATEMAAKAAKMELELAGEDPESRKADALQDLSDAQLRAIIEATDIPTESKTQSPS